MSARMIRYGGFSFLRHNETEGSSIFGIHGSLNESAILEAVEKARHGSAGRADGCADILDLPSMGFVDCHESVNFLEAKVHVLRAPKAGIIDMENPHERFSEAIKLDEILVIH